MPFPDLEPQEAAVPVDEMTETALGEAEESFWTEESVSLEQSQLNARERYQAWKKSQELETIAA